MSVYDLPCIVVEDMNQHELRQFIPKLLKRVTGRNKPGYGKDATRPEWWPDDLPWSNPKYDTRCDMTKEISWTEALRKIVRSCYRYHGLNHLLKCDGASSSHGQLDVSMVTPTKDASPLIVGDLSHTCYSDTPQSLEARVAPIPMQPWSNQPGAEHASEPSQAKTEHSKRPLIRLKLFRNLGEDASHPILIDTNDDAFDKFMDIYICFFCEREYHSCSELQSHQETCDSRPPELNIICPSIEIRKNMPTPPQISPKATVYARPSKEIFISSLGLVQGDQALVLRNKEQKEEVDCEIIDVEEAPCLPPTLTPTTPNTPKRLLSVLSPIANRRFEELFAESNPSDADSECSKSDISEREPCIRHKGGASLLAIDMCSPLGQRIKKHVKVDNPAGTVKHPHYEQFCHTPVKDKFRERLRDRVETYPITFKRRSKVKHEHSYKFTKAHKREFMLRMKTGLSKQSRPLLKCIRKCSVLLHRMSNSELKKWRKPVRFALIDLEPLTEQEINKWTNHHYYMPATFPIGPVLLSKDIDQILGLKKKLFGSPSPADLRRSLTLSQVVSEAVNAEVSQQTMIVYKSLLNEYAQDLKDREENMKFTGLYKNQSPLLLSMLKSPTKDMVPSVEKTEPCKTGKTFSKDKAKDATDKDKAVKCAGPNTSAPEPNKDESKPPSTYTPETKKDESKPLLTYRQSRYRTRFSSQASTNPSDKKPAEQSVCDNEPRNKSPIKTPLVEKRSYIQDTSESLPDKNKDNGHQSHVQSQQRERKSSIEEAGNKTPVAKASALGDLKIKITLSPQKADTEEDGSTTRNQMSTSDRQAEVPTNNLRYGLRSRRKDSTQVSPDCSHPSDSSVSSRQSDESSESEMKDRTDLLQSVKSKNDQETVNKTSTNQKTHDEFKNKAFSSNRRLASTNDINIKLNMKKILQASAENELCAHINKSPADTDTSTAKEDRGDLKMKISLKRSLTEPSSTGFSPPEKRISLYRIELPNTPASVAVEGLTNTSSILFKCRICSLQQVYHKGACDAIEQHISNKHKGDVLNIVRHRPQEEGYDIGVYEIESARGQKNAFIENSKTDTSNHPAAPKKPVSVVKPTYRKLFDEEANMLETRLQTRRTSSPLQPHHFNLNPQAPAKAPLSVSANIEPAATERTGVNWHHSALTDTCPVVTSVRGQPSPQVLSSDDDDVIIMKEVICLDA